MKEADRKSTYCTVPFIGNARIGKSTEKAIEWGLSMAGWGGEVKGREGKERNGKEKSEEKESLV